MSVDTTLETDVYNGEGGHAAKHNAVNAQVNWLTDQLAALDVPGQVTDAIDALVSGAPGALDTLKEIADQLDSDESAAGALTTLVNAIRNLTDSTFAANLVTGLAATFARRGAGFLPDAGAQTLFFDDFHRSDRNLLGDAAPSGHIYRVQGATNAISGHALAPAPSGSGDVQIAFVQHGQDYGQISGEGYFVPGATAGEGPVLGSCLHDFGHNGSLQLTFYASNRGYDWELFTYTDHETPIATGNWLSGFTIQPGTLYAWSMRRTGKNTVILHLPDGQVVEVTNSAVSACWGVTAGFQLRRQVSTDGFFVFTRIATTAPRQPLTPQYVPGGIAKMPGLTTDFFSCPAPAAGWGITDLDLRGIVALDTYNTTSQDLASVWDAPNSQKSFVAQMTSTGKLKLNVSLDGAASLSAVSTGASPYVNGQQYAWAITRSAASGDVDFYYSANTAAVDLPVSDPAWVHISTVSTTAGAPFNSKAPLNVAHDDSGSAAMTGSVTACKLLASIGGAALAFFDLRGTWTFRDTVGNRWQAYGSQWTWSVSLAGYAPLASPALTGTPTVNGGAIPLARAAILRPAGVVRETIDRSSGPSIASGGLNALTSGQLLLAAIPLAAGDVVSNITFVTGSVAGVTPTHWWFGLFDASRNLLALTADQTTTALPASTVTTLPIAAVAAGAASSFTVPATGLYYLGVMVAAGTVPNLCGSSATANTILNRSTKLAGTADTGMTTPPAFPFIAAALSSVANWLYGSVS